MATDIATITEDIYAAKDAFAAVLAEPSLNFEREAGFAIQVLEANSYALKIAMSARQSVVDAVTNIAAIGISLNPAKKQAYLVPRKGKICLDISYMGLMDLAMATGSVRWGQAKLVYESDVFELNGVDVPPTHKAKPFAADRGDIVGVYVIIKTADGDYLTHPMSIDDVYAARDRSESWKAYVKDNTKLNPWVTDEGEMIKKTCVKQAYKYWPKTERLERAIHYLNTDGGEGLYGSGPQQTGDIAEEWIKRAVDAQSSAALQAVWSQGLGAIKQSGDMVAYSKFKAFVTTRLELLRQQEANTFEGQKA